MSNYVEIPSLHSDLMSIKRLIKRVETALDPEYLEEDVDCQRLLLEVKAMTELLDYGKINTKRNLQN